MRPYPELCASPATPDEKAHCERSVAFHQLVKIISWQDAGDHVLECESMQDNRERSECIAIKIYYGGRRDQNKSYCAALPARWGHIAGLCTHI